MPNVALYDGNRHLCLRPSKGFADHRGIDFAPQGREERRRPSLAACGHQFRGAVAHSYLVLAGAISSTANSLYQLVRDYKDFTSNTFRQVSKKPFVAWYYADANVAISREIKHCYKLYASVASSGVNLMKASMDEKLNLVMTLKNTIDKARYIIDNANLYCFLITDCGWKPDYIWEILNSNVKDEIANKVIKKWNQGYAS